MSKKPILVVLAAGMGSRYGGLKQIDPVGQQGEAILDYSLYDARRAGFDTVVFIIKHEIEADFKATVGARAAKSGMEIRYAFQQLEKLPQGYAVPEGRVKPWGTGHAILCAGEAIDAPFAVINADDYYGPAAYKEVYDYLSQAQEGPDSYCMVGFLLKNTVSENGTVSRGVCTLSGEGTLDTLTERTAIAPYEGGIHSTEDGGARYTDLAPDTLVSMNLFGFPADFVAQTREGFAPFLDTALKENPMKGEYFLPSVVNRLMAENKVRVKVLTSPDKWYGVTYQEDKPVVQAAIAAMTAQGLYPSPLWG